MTFLSELSESSMYKNQSFLFLCHYEGQVEPLVSPPEVLGKFTCLVTTEEINVWATYTLPNQARFPVLTGTPKTSITIHGSPGA